MKILNAVKGMGMVESASSHSAGSGLTWLTTLEPNQLFCHIFLKNRRKYTKKEKSG